jgi:predicted dehydrogenase
VRSLITHRIPVERATHAYDIITGKANEPFLGVLITYPEQVEDRPHLEVVTQSTRPAAGEGTVSVGLLGAGSFALSTLLPAMKQVEGIAFVGACAATGPHAHQVADRFGFRYCSTDEGEILNDQNVNTVVIATRHHLHAAQVIAALRAGKHVFCEKPLCITEDELVAIAKTYSQPSVPKRLLMVGFNRRFAPMAVQMKSFVDSLHGPLALHYRVNAGSLPADHWVNDPEQGGGRILGEACHFIDFLTFLAGSPPVEVQTRNLAGSDESAIIGLQFANGSQGTVSYLADGDRSFSKERVEIFGGESVAVLEDFRTLELVRNGRRQVSRSRWRQDKGHRGEWEAFANALRSGGESPIGFDEIISTTLATLRAVESRTSGQAVPVDAGVFISQSHSRADG